MCFDKLASWLGFAFVFQLLLSIGGSDALLHGQRISQHSYQPAYRKHVFPKQTPQNPSRTQSFTRSPSGVASRPQTTIRSQPSRSAPQSTQYNHRSVQSSRSSAGPRGSSRSNGRSNAGRFVGSGYGVAVYNPYLYGYRGRVYGAPVQGYATYGTYLSVGDLYGGAFGGGAYGGGVYDVPYRGSPLTGGVVGSSVAAEAFERMANGQPVVPAQGDPNASLAAENLRLQIELERARQQLALQNQNLPDQQPVPLPASLPDDGGTVIFDADAAPGVADQLGLAAIIETNELAKASQLNGERAFRAGDYGKAARFAALAVSLDESNGRLQLFALQSHFANGEYQDAVQRLQAAIALLPPADLSFMIENFKLFYGQDDFVSHTRALSEHLRQSPEDGAAWMLRGYLYGALGYPDAANSDFDRARGLGVSPQSLDVLEKRFAPLAAGVR